MNKDNLINKLKKYQESLDPVKIGYAEASRKWARLECIIHRLNMKTMGFKYPLFLEL